MSGRPRWFEDAAARHVFPHVTTRVVFSSCPANPESLLIRPPLTVPLPVCYQPPLCLGGAKVAWRRQNTESPAVCITFSLKGAESTSATPQMLLRYIAEDFNTPGHGLVAFPV